MTLTDPYLHPAAPSGHGPEPAAQPFVDKDSLLRFEGRWVALTELQVPVVNRLLDDLGAMVSLGELREAYAAGGGSTDFDAMRSLLFRVGRRLDQVGLEVVFARRRTGMMVSRPVLE